MKVAAAVSLLLTLLVTASVAQTTWDPELQLKLKVVGQPRVSPDGKKVVYTVSEPVMTADRSEFVTQVWMATTDGKQHIQLTYGDKSSTNAKWSPDGNWIAFLSNRRNVAEYPPESRERSDSGWLSYLCRKL